MIKMSRVVTIVMMMVTMVTIVMMMAMMVTIVMMMGWKWFRNVDDDLSKKSDEVSGHSIIAIIIIIATNNITLLTLIVLPMIIIAEVLEGRGWTWGVVPCNDNRLFLFMARLPNPCRDTLVIIIVKNTDLIF